MKKFLALVLALVMTFSLVTISAGAEDFTDDASITYEEAVDVMTAIGVVGGYADGSFNPEAGLTRGAAAKIICNMILGPTTADALVADAAPYSDVAVDNVFAGYIAYCAQEGIISGYADGTFRPAAPLTGYAFMKMLLGTLGYDAAKEGYVGSNWSIAVAKQALALGLDDGLVSDFAGAKALTREEACLYALNTLQATMVKYENASTITVGDIVIQNNSKAEPVKEAGVEVTFMDTYFSKLEVATTSADAFDAPANAWSWKNEEVGTYTKTADATYTELVEYGDLYTAIGSNAVKKLDTLNVFVDGKDVSGSYNKADIVKGSEVDVAGTGNGVQVAVYVYADATDDTLYDVTITIINTYVGKVNKVTAETAAKDRFVTLHSTFGSDVSDVNGSASMVNWEFTTEDFAKGDYVTYTVAETAPGNQYKVQSMALVEKADTGVVTAYKNTSATSNFTVNGVTYKYNVVKDVAGIALDNEIDVYVDQFGFVVLTELFNGANDLSKYLVLTNKAYNSSLSTSVIASAVTLDGKALGEITLGKLDGSKIASTSAVDLDTVYSFSVAEDGKYNLKAVAAPYFGWTFDMTGSGDGYTTGSATYNGDVVNSATQFVVQNTTKDTVTVYEGIKNMVNVADANVTAAAGLYKDGKIVALYMEVTSTTSNDSAAEDLVYVLDTKFVATKDGDDVVYTYDAIVNGKLGTISTKDVGATSGDVAKTIADGGVGLYYIDNYDKAYVADNGLKVASTSNAPTDMDAYMHDLTTAAVTYADDVLVIGSNTYVVDADCAVFSVSALGEMTEIDVSELENDNSSYTYWVVTLTENSVTEAVAVYLQK